MGLFNKKRGAAGKHDAPTIIAERAIISGELTLSSNIQVDGKITGVLRTDHNVTISPTGSVEGTIFADNAIINGVFVGDIYAKKIEILSKGELKGDITCAEFIIQKGGQFLGNSKTVSNEEVVNLSDSKESHQPIATKVKSA